MKLLTERLMLREFVEADVSTMHAWHVDPRYLEHYPEDAVSVAYTRDLVQRFIDWQIEQPRWRWQLAVVRLDTDELNPNVWGRGYITEAMGGLLAFAFEDIGLADVTARVVDTNLASLRVLQRLGFSHAFDLAPGEGRDGRIWPHRAEYRLERQDWRRNCSGASVQDSPDSHPDVES